MDKSKQSRSEQGNQPKSVGETSATKNMVIVHDVWHIMTDAKYHHLVLIHSGDRLNYYVDGKLTQSISDTKISKAKN